MRPNTKALVSGIAGATALNIAHDSGHHLLHDSPHVDLIAVKALGKTAKFFGIHPHEKTLRRIAFAGDIITNSLAYALAVNISRAGTRASWIRSAVYGLAVGTSVVTLPPLLGLGQQKTSNLPKTAALTVAWYTIGALVAAGVAQALAGKNSPKIHADLEST